MYIKRVTTANTKKALDKFKLPIDVIEGHLGELVLQIPWSNLKGKPVQVVIEDVYLLAKPKLEQEIDIEEEERRTHALKMEKLEHAEILDKNLASGLTKEEQQKNQSFTESLVTKIVDNLQITIKNIHIRYEDQESVPGHPLSVGMTLEELSAVSTDDEWNPTFLQDTSEITKKLAKLNALSVYWNTDSDTIKPEDTELGIVERFKNTIPKNAGDIDSNQYILKPVSGIGRITMHKDGPTATLPKTKAQLLFDELGFVFDSDQYRDVLWTADFLRLYMKTQHYKKHRPKSTVKEDPKAWFKYVANAVLEEIHEKKREWSWDFIYERWQTRLRYIELYKTKRTGTLTQEEQEEFNKFEWQLNYEDLRFYRQLAKSELRKEKAKTDHHHSQAQNQQQGWVGWLWYGNQQQQPHQDDDLTMTEEQKKEFYDAIEWDEKEAMSQIVDVPRDRVKLEVETSLNSGSFTLKRDPHGKHQDVAVVSFNGFKASLWQRPDSFLTNISLQELRVDDKTGSSLYEQVVTVKDLEDVSVTPNDSVCTLDNNSNNSNDAFFWLSFEQNPLDGNADSNLNVKLKSITIFYNKLFVETIAKFFKPPKTHLETIGAIMNAAGATVEGLRDQTRIGLEYALSEHKTVNVKMDLQAPLVVIPLDVTSWESPCAVIDAGHMSLESDLVSQEVLDEVRSKQTQQYTDEDWKRLENLMYDKFKLQLHDTQFLIGANVRDTMKHLKNKDENPAYVIDRINLNFLAQVSIVPEAASLTKFKLSGSLPLFRASMSDAKYKLMMQIIDNCIPNFDFDSFDEETKQNLARERRVSLVGGPGSIIEEEEESDSDNTTLANSRASLQTRESSSQKPEQKVFEFNFKVDKVDLSLHRCVDNSTLAQDQLIDMVLEHFELDFYFKPSEMMADVTLGTLSIEDYIDKTSPMDLRKIASSQSGAIAKDLFNVQYKRIKRQDQENVFDQYVEVSMSTIRFVLAPKSSMTLLDFIITTFTNPNNDDNSDQQSISTAVEDEKDDALIDVKVNLNSIILTLNDDGIKLATLQLDSATVGVDLVGDTMKVESKIGSLTLQDDVNEGTSQKSMLRQLVSIEGDNLAHFKYETYDLSRQDMDYNSSIYFRAGSIKANVVEEPLNRIFKFLMRLNQMKGLYDAARQAAMNQANQIQDPDKIHFDVCISTPILVFPRLVADSEDGDCDMLTVELGEFYLNNKFENDNGMVNKIDAGVRNTRLSTKFHFDTLQQNLEIIDNLDIGFDICYVTTNSDVSRPSLTVKSKMSDVEMNITELQFRYILGLSKSVPEMFNTFGLEDAKVGELEEELKQSKRIDENMSSSAVSEQQQQSSSETTNDKLDFSFDCKKIALELYHNTQNVEDITSKSLSKFSLNDTGIKLRVKNDDGYESDVHIHSFTVHDTRQDKGNKFSEIIPSITHDEYQFMCKAKKGGGDNGPMDIMLTVDSPKMILALEYLFAVKEFIDFGFNDENNTSPPEEELQPELSQLKEQVPENKVGSDQQQQQLSFHVNIVDAYLILLANPKSEDSEAVVFKTDQLVLSQRATSTLSVSKVGMFLCQMSRFNDNRLKMLDDFSMTATMDTRGADERHQLNQIQVSVEPLVLRLSLRDILLALDIVTKASQLSQGESNNKNIEQSATPRYSKFSKKEIRKRFPGAKSVATRSSNKQNYKKGATGQDLSKTIVRGEELTAEFEGLRFVVIGMHHELPMLDMCVKPFTASAKNWSSDLKVDVATETFTNVYNPSKSAWEPLIETWDMGFHVSKADSNEAMFVNMVSRRLMEVTLTAQTIALLNRSLEFMMEKRDDSDFLLRPRESNAPYRIKNETGYPIDVWIDDEDDRENETNNLHTIEDGDEIPWRFHDWNVVRENLSTDMQQVNLGVRLKDSPYDPVKGVSVTSEGDHLYILYPKTTRVLHRLLCEVKLEQDLKRIVLRSALNVENKTQVSVDMEVPDTGLKWTLEPGESRSVPIKYAYDNAIRVRPDKNLGFIWSEKIEWKRLLTESPSVACHPSKPQNDSSFYFQIDGKYDKSTPLSRVYPHMKIVLTAPIEIVNLLPVDFSYRIYDKDTKKDWSNWLKRGETSPVHVVQLSHLLLLSIHPKEGGYERTDFAIVNSHQNDFRRENTMVTRSDDGQKLNLRLQYLSQQETGSGYQVAVYSPYLILNKTGLDLQVKCKGNVANSRMVTYEHSEAKKAAPKMWSYERDDRGNRAMLRIGDSKWSREQSFEAIGSDYEVVVQSVNNQNELHAGVSVSEGMGRYKLTRIVTLAPRFVLSNKLKDDILFKDPQSSNTLTVKPNSFVPVHFLKQQKAKQLLACFPGAKSQWSAPFNIANIGRTHIKLHKHDEGYKLLKVDIILEGATLYLHIDDAKRNWPYSVRNFTRMDFIFYQVNPYVDEQGVELSDHPKFVPIRYKIPGKSVMPYAWDYPAAPMKEIMIECNGKERRVQLAEIGNLPPMKVPSTNTTRGCIVDLNVVADGPTQTLVLSDYDPSTSMYKMKNTSQGSVTSSTAEFSVDDEEDDEPTFNFNIKSEGIGLSLINRRMFELCYVTVRGWEVNYRSSELYDTFSTKIKWVQVDNQLYGGIYPIILFPSVVPKNGREMENHPSFSGSVTRVKDEAHGVLFIKHATVLLQQMTLEVDEDFLFALMEFAKSPHDTWADPKDDKLCDEELDIPQPMQNATGLDVYFEVLHIQPAQMDLSFVRTERVNVEDRPSSGNAVMFFFNMLTMAIGNINDAPVKLNALIMENVRTPLPLLVQSISTHYSQEFLYQVHKILGSADFIGNPVGLFNNLSSGFMDMFYEPYQGYILNDRPQELGIGIAKGGLSFMKKSIFGVSDSFAKVTGSISKGLAVATMDKNFQSKRRMKISRNRPKHALFGLATGANSFVEGVSSGVSGLALSPYQGASREGAAGFMKGLGKGLVGLPTKTAIGFFDLASSVSEGVRNTTTVFDGDAIDKVRPTRFIGHDGIVRPYSEREAVGQSWAKQVDNGRYFDDEYLAHLNMGSNDMVVLVTFSRIMLVSTVKMVSEWVVKYQELQTIAMERTGLALVLRGAVQGPFIPISDMSSRRFLYKQVGIAVSEFNRKNQTLT